MIAVTLTALFVLAAVAAMGTIALTWQQHGAAALQAAGHAAACPETIIVRFTVRELQVRRDAGNVVALPVRQRVQPVVQSLPQPPLRAAA